MSEATGWTKVGPVWQRLYPNGNLGQCLMCADGQWWPEVFDADGGRERIASRGAIDGIKKILDDHCTPQPELVRRGKDWTFYEHKGRGVLVWQDTDCRSAWNVTFSDGEGQRFNWKEREKAEVVARSFVMGEESK